MFFYHKLNGGESVRDKFGLAVCFYKSPGIALKSSGPWDRNFFLLVLGLFHGQQEISCFKTNIPLVKLQAICLDIWSLFDPLTIFSLLPLVPGTPGLPGGPIGFSLNLWETGGWIFLCASLLGTDI